MQLLLLPIRTLSDLFMLKGHIINDSVHCLSCVATDANVNNCHSFVSKWEKIKSIIRMLRFPKPVSLTLDKYTT